MGAWGTGSFENDTALDWLGELETDGLVAVRAAFDVLGETFDASDGANALAAAEIVAAANGRASEDLPEEATAWVAANRSRVTPADVIAARRAVKVVGERSELRELWDETDSARDWLGAVADLLRRL